MHTRRVQSHIAAASLLRAAQDEWAAVCYFYAVFHTVRAALLADSRLDSDASARSLHSRLSASSRHVDFHEGHPSRGPGLNQVVRYVYPAIAAKYVLLHVKSVEVRYEDGLQATSIQDVARLASDVISHLEDAGLVTRAPGGD